MARRGGATDEKEIPKDIPNVTYIKRKYDRSGWRQFLFGWNEIRILVRVPTA